MHLLMILKSGFGTIEDMMLDFTLPGYDIEIRVSGIILYYLRTFFDK